MLLQACRGDRVQPPLTSASHLMQSAVVRRASYMYWYSYVDAKENSNAMRHRIQRIPSTSWHTVPCYGAAVACIGIGPLTLKELQLAAQAPSSGDRRQDYYVTVCVFY